MISSVWPADSLYNVTYYFINNGKLTINHGKPMKITALRQRAVDIVRRLSTDPVFKGDARIIEIVSSDGGERYVELEQAQLFVNEADGPGQPDS
jgi:hypothetical protein